MELLYTALHMVLSGLPRSVADPRWAVFFCIGDSYRLGDHYARHGSIVRRRSLKTLPLPKTL
jgi:hypothetical protein